MNLLRPTLVGLGLMLAGFARADTSSTPAISPATAAERPPAPLVATNLMPPAAKALSPVAVFRRLLDMNSKERENYLVGRPAEIRAAIRAKIQEYLAMDPDDRELRLRATELRWQLVPLLKLAPADRAQRLAVVPEDLAPLVKSRLADWDQLPAALQKEFLDNDRTLHYFTSVETTNQATTETAAAAQREKIARQFDQFFELNSDEKQQTLKTLSRTEQAQMEQTLLAFSKLNGQQRHECVLAFAKFAEMSGAERVDFLKNAERWSQMSPKERQAWRDLVARVPSWPPLPPHPISNLLPPSPHPKPHASMATN